MQLRHKRFVLRLLVALRQVKGGRILSKKNIIKMIVLNLLIIAVNLTLFSCTGITIDLEAGTLDAALGWTLAVMSGAVFCYGNWELLSDDEKHRNKHQTKLLKENDLTSIDDHIRSVSEQSYKLVLKQEIDDTEDQLRRLKEKQDSLSSVLSQRFSPEDENFEKFQSVINSVRSLFLSNSLKIINRMRIFDYEDYRRQCEKLRYDPMSGGTGDIEASESIEVYQQQIDEIRGIIHENEIILSRLNDLLLEITKLNEENETPAANSSAMEEMDLLISQTKYYNM